MSQQLRDWLNSNKEPRRNEVAAKAATSVAYLWQLAGRHRKPSLKMAARLQDASGGELTIEGLRPDVFASRSASQSTPPTDAPAPAERA